MLPNADRVRSIAGTGLFLVLASSVPARAQTPLSEILVKLIQSDVRLAPVPPGSPFPSHDTHFLPGEQAALAPRFFNQVISSQLTTFPLGSSSGGFTYTFDAALGTFARGTASFGPSFAERAQTIGRNKIGIGANFQHASFDTFEGKNLDDGSIKFYLTHAPVGGQFFEGDIIETALRLRLSTNTFDMFANYGVLDKLDVGIAVPIVSVSMEANIDATVMRLATGTTGPTSMIHMFLNGTEQNTFSNSGSKTGIGDVLLRAKYRFLDISGGGLAGILDLRLPSGDSANLLGTGATQAKIAVVASTTYNQFSPHVNVGYTVSGNSKATFFSAFDEVDYTFGGDVVASPKVTLAFDALGRTLRGVGRLQEQQRTFNFRNVANVPGSVTLPEFAYLSGSNLNSLLGSAGVKFNAFGNLLISANVLVPFTQAGIRSKLTPVIGFDYAF